jgi:general stress protein YciG
MMNARNLISRSFSHISYVARRRLPASAMCLQRERRFFTTEKRGFAAMDPEQQREIARKGGQASHGGGQKQETTQASSAPQRAYAYQAQPHHRNLKEGDLLPGDMVRYQVGGNMTEGIVQSVNSSPFTDEHGRTHRATKENPMAKLENYWTKNVVYHHLSALEWLARKEQQQQQPQQQQSQQVEQAQHPERGFSPLEVDLAPGDIHNTQLSFSTIVIDFPDI